MSRLPRSGGTEAIVCAAFAGALSLGCCGIASARTTDDGACLQATAAAQSLSGVPRTLLRAIGLVETGRPGADGNPAAWPWSVDADGAGHFYRNRRDAEQAVLRFQAQGLASIDVGCMQINLHYHPHAFATLDEAFSPAANTQYAAAFLRSLYLRSDNWVQAAGAYHSETASLAVPYRNKVLTIWTGGPAPADADTADADPHHVLTDVFRERLVADAAFRAARDAAMEEGQGFHPPPPIGTPAGGSAPSVCGSGGAAPSRGCGGETPALPSSETAFVDLHHIPRREE